MRRNFIAGFLVGGDVMAKVGEVKNRPVKIKE